jgi:hypothetical protein
MITDLENAEDEDSQTAAYAHLVRGQIGNGNLWYILDALEADLETVASAVLDSETGYLLDEIVESVEATGSQILILNSVVCDKRLAGRKVGRWIAAEAIATLAEDTAVVVAYAAPPDSSEGQAREAAKAKLRKVWRSIGFEDLEDRDSLLILDPAMQTPVDRLNNLRTRFGVK